MTDLDLAQQFTAHLAQGDLVAWAATLTPADRNRVGEWVSDYLAAFCAALGNPPSPSRLTVTLVEGDSDARP